MPRKPRSDMHCQYVSPLGRKCRQLRDPGHPSLCQQHSGQPRQALNESCAAQLLGQIEDFASAAPGKHDVRALVHFLAGGRNHHGQWRRNDAVESAAMVHNDDVEHDGERNPRNV